METFKSKSRQLWNSETEPRWTRLHKCSCQIAPRRIIELLNGPGVEFRLREHDDRTKQRQHGRDEKHPRSHAESLNRQAADGFGFDEEKHRQRWTDESSHACQKDVDAVVK